ncbi:g3630 [Coccomyxa elongata]
MERSEHQEEKNKVEFQATRRIVNAAVLLGAPISLFLQGNTAHASSAQDAMKQTDPSMSTISPPKIGDVIESGAKVAGSTMESAPPPDVGQAIKEGVKRMDVPDPLKTVLPDKNSGFNILSQGAGNSGKSRDPNSFRNRIVDEALTDQSPRRNLEK